MGALHSKKSNVAKYNLKKTDSAIWGFDGEYPEWFNNEFRKSKKAVLTKRLADMLELDYLVPKTEYVILNIAGDKKYGILICVSISLKLSVSSFMEYLKGRSILMIYDRHSEQQSKWSNAFWARGYYVATEYNRDCN